MLAPTPNPRDRVLDLVKCHPEASKEDLFQQFRDGLDEAGRRAVEWFFFINMYDACRPSAPRAPKPLNLRADAQRLTAKVREIVLLDVVMPNGKAMRECTGAEMLRFGSRYQKIGERVGKAKLVGSVLKEDEVQAIFRS